MTFVHSVKMSLFGGEREFGLEQDAIVCGDTRIRYADVNNVRLSRVPTQQGILRVCRLRDKHGKKIKIYSLNYRSLTKVEDRVKTYAPLVRELLLRIGTASPLVKCQANSSFLWWTYAVLLTLLVLLVGLLIVVAVMEPSAALATTAPVFVLVFVGPLMWQYLKTPPRRFDPSNPPGDLLEH